MAITLRKAKKTYHHGSLRRALVETAVEVVAQRGIDALNLRELAGRAGVSTGAPYHHFASREALLKAIAEEGFTQFGAHLTAERDAAPADAAARLQALGRAYISFAVAHPGSFRVMFHGDAMASGPTEPGQRAFHLLRDAIVACQAAGAAPKGDPALLVLTAWSAVHGLATLWVDGALPFEGIDPGRLAPDVGRIVVSMLAALAREAEGAESPIDRPTVGPERSETPRV